ncbi:hypothetical protein [Geobacter benzoatilyticus]|uniref:Guanylate cyclase domain-containing protein n=1 Tax=Geobacter benzoatilyticus TaxID=2815309 RepID=A0ABX7Q2N1_9BACT|nr:hypothetical protein [Geobacter benzoatilyticus]QSV45295.1 hypothetical protein JZM60_14375 [Geobacter benzoatilyticus]
MLSAEKKVILNELVCDCLDEAESIWEEVGPKVLKKAMAAMYESAEVSQIPGHPIVESGKPKVDTFIAMAVDMRDSTNHLMCAISSKNAKISQLQRIFYETSALLPAMAKLIMFEDGSVTEYLGDGVLGLFRVSEKNTDAIYSANKASRNCLYAVSDIINPILYERYCLPPLAIGIGLAISKAVVTLVGTDDYKQPKAFGECVFRATKLSGGNNEIITDEALKNAWPSSKTGTLKFLKRNIKNIDGYLLYKDSA